jgi:hypothetical protein
MCKKICKSWPHGLGKKSFFSYTRQEKKLPILCKKASFLSQLLNGKSVLGKKKISMYFINLSTSTKIFKKSWPKVVKWQICHRGPLGLSGGESQLGILKTNNVKPQSPKVEMKSMEGRKEGRKEGRNEWRGSFRERVAVESASG